MLLQMPIQQSTIQSVLPCFFFSQLTMFFFFSNNKWFLLFLLANSFTYPFSLQSQSPHHVVSRITVLGSVYCDVCHANAFAKHSFFLPGVDVHVECKFKASPPGTTEQISFSVNRTTDKYGMYKLEMTNIDGVDCAEDPTIQSFCQARLMGSSVPICNVPSTRATSTEITLKSKHNYVCTYSLGALSYKPIFKNFTLCGNNQGIAQELGENSWNSSKFFLPYLPPYVFPWPPFPQLPPLPPLPPFPYPQNPNSPPALVTPPGFNWSDPRTWIPYYPLLSPPPPPPSPPVFNFWDPRTWIPHFPPTNQTSLKP